MENTYSSRNVGMEFYICPRASYCNNSLCYHREQHIHTEFCNLLTCSLTGEAGQCVLYRNEIIEEELFQL